MKATVKLIYMPRHADGGNCVHCAFYETDNQCPKFSNGVLRCDDGHFKIDMKTVKAKRKYCSGDE